MQCIIFIVYRCYREGFAFENMRKTIFLELIANASNSKNVDAKKNQFINLNKIFETNNNFGGHIVRGQNFFSLL